MISTYFISRYQNWSSDCNGSEPCWVEDEAAISLKAPMHVRYLCQQSMDRGPSISLIYCRSTRDGSPSLVSTSRRKSMELFFHSCSNMREAGIWISVNPRVRLEAHLQPWCSGFEKWEDARKMLQIPAYIWMTIYEAAITCLILLSGSERKSRTLPPKIQLSLPNETKKIKSWRRRRTTHVWSGRRRTTPSVLPHRPRERYNVQKQARRTYCKRIDIWQAQRVCN